MESATAISDVQLANYYFILTIAMIHPAKPVVLSRLREEWLQRLQSRNQHVNEIMREEKIRKAQRVQEFLGLQRGN